MPQHAHWAVYVPRHRFQNPTKRFNADMLSINVRMVMITEIRRSHKLLCSQLATLFWMISFLAGKRSEFLPYRYPSLKALEARPGVEPTGGACRSGAAAVSHSQYLPSTCAYTRLV